MHLNIPRCKVFFKKHGKYFYFSIAYGIILFAILLTLARYLSPQASQYKPQLEAWLTARIGQSVRIQHLETGWDGLQPVVRAKHVLIETKQQSALEIASLQIGVDILSSLVHAQLQPGRLLIDGMSLKVREGLAGWQLNGWPLAHSGSPTSLSWLVPVAFLNQTLQVKHLTLQLYPLSKPPILLNNIQGVLMNRWGQHRLRLEGILAEKKPSRVVLGIEGILDPAHVMQSSGRLYGAVESLNLAKWLAGILPINIKTGTLTTEFWGEIASGRLSAVQAKVALHHLSWQEVENAPVHKLPFVQGHIVWTKLLTDWRLIGDPIQIVDEKGAWPETSFRFQTNRMTQQGTLFVKHVWVERVMPLLPLVWKQQAAALLSHLPIKAPVTSQHVISSAARDLLPSGTIFKAPLKVHEIIPLKGQLRDLWLSYKPHTWALLTEFSKLSFQLPGYPSISNASGVVSVSPQKGHIKLNSEAMRWTLPKHPRLKWSRVNLEAEWAKEPQGWRIQLGHLVALHPHLTLKANGEWTHITAHDLGRMQLQASFLMKQGQYWMRHLPTGWLKPRLEEWLREEIYEIGTVNGQLSLAGALRDFPFVRGDGMFQIRTVLTGVDLSFSPEWLPAEAISGQLWVDKRRLEAWIDQATIGEVRTNAVHVSVDQLGSDREHLLVHGTATAAAEKAWPIMLQSPLALNSAFLSRMSWDYAPVSLDLQIDAALYPEAEGILVRGKTLFTHNQLKFTWPQAALTMTDLTGTLYFNEKGLLPSQLQGLLFNHNMPVTVAVSALPQHTTFLKGHTEVEIDKLFESLHIATPKALSGAAHVHAILRLPSGEGAVNQLKIKTDLAGVQIDYPPYLHKKAKESQSLDITTSFLPEGAHMKAQYQDLLTVEHSEKGIWTAKAHLPLVFGQVSYNPSTRVLTGDLEKWILSDNRSSNWSLKPSDLPAMVMNIHHLQYGELRLGDLSFKAKSGEKRWEVSPWTLQTPAYKMQGNLIWEERNSQQKTQLTLSLQAPQVKDLLTWFHYNSWLDAGHADMQLETSWSGGPWLAALSSMKGEVSAMLMQGRTVALSRETESRLGLGKLFSLFSLQTIPRRLKLDFSDLSNEGFSFDKCEGDFLLDHGVLRIKNATMDGPVAHATSYGEINLLQQWYALTVHVFPHVTSSLPVVAAIAGGPVVGVAAFMASKILTSSMQKVTETAYRVTGPWKDPVIEPITRGR